MTTPDSAETLEELVARVQSNLGAACAMVTEITGDRQTVLAHAGRPLPEWFIEGAPLDYSICQHCVAMDFPLVIDDAISHPLMHGNRAVSELNFAAYIGAPVRRQPRDGQGRATGAISAVEFHQRRWTEAEIRYITEAARIADTLLVNRG